MCYTMSGGGGYSQSESEQMAQSLGPLGSASGTIRGQGQNILSNLLFGREAGRFAGTGIGGGGILGDLRVRTLAPVEYSTPSLSPRGLTTEQETQAGLTEQSLRTPFQQAVAQALGNVSSAYTQRGFNRPENIQAIAGSAAQNVAPQFAQLYANLGSQYQGMGTENVMQRTQAQLVREDLLRQRFTDLLNALGINVSALGGQSQSYGASKSMSVQASGSGSKGPSTTP